MSESQSSDVAPLPPSRWRELWTTEDWWAVWLGVAMLLGILLTVTVKSATDTSGKEKAKAATPLAPWVVRPGEWKGNPSEAFISPASTGKDGKPVAANNRWPGILSVGLALGGLLSLAMKVMGRPVVAFGTGYVGVFVLAAISFAMAEQQVVKYYNFEYVLWALVLGLVISNTWGVPRWMLPGARTEFYIKTGLVLLGVDVLLGRLLQLGPPGILTSWVVTPVVLVSTYLFGQYVLKMPSKSLNLVISADMSVCGVSAAIATASACKAKKEELSLAIGLSLAFTAVMMIVQPAVARHFGMDPYVAGAWIGGTIDSTGAVAAAGNILSTDSPADGVPETPAQSQDRKAGAQVAIVVKMIQNTLIGVISFCVAIYWVTCVEKNPNGQRPSLMEIWYRFPKFSLGFIGVSLLFSVLSEQLSNGSIRVEALSKTAKTLREWLFCLGFVSIGLETNFRELAEHLKGGKALILYVVGQSLNLLLSFLMAWWTFGHMYHDYVRSLPLSK